MHVRTGRLFVGLQQPCKAFLRNTLTNYIYILRRPDGRPFYVGQGFGSRVFFHENEARHANNWKTNDHKLNVIRSIWRSGDAVTYEIDFVSANSVEINDREEQLIREFGRLHEGGPLTNRAPGGRSLEEPSPFSKDKHTATLSGIPENDPESATLNRFVFVIAPMKSARKGVEVDYSITSGARARHASIRRLPSRSRRGRQRDFPATMSRECSCASPSVPARSADRS